MTRGLAIASISVALVLGAPTASGLAATVNIQFQAFAPAQLEVLPGETVEWHNVSERRHTVTADGGAFDSGDLLGGESFSARFPDLGPYPYHCTVHPGMIGEVDVTPVTLDPLPVQAIPAGQYVEFSGRTADPGRPVRIERLVGPGDARPVASAVIGPDGSWHVSAPVTATGDYRAAADAGVSRARRLLVSDRRVLLRVRKHGVVAVTVVPPLPYARVTLELRLKDRFGWWPQTRVRLDYTSEKVFRVPRGVLARVALVDADGWSALVTSPQFRLP